MAFQEDLNVILDNFNVAFDRTVDAAGKVSHTARRLADRVDSFAGVAVRERDQLPETIEYYVTGDEGRQREKRILTYAVAGVGILLLVTMFNKKG